MTRSMLNIQVSLKNEKRIIVIFEIEIFISFICWIQLVVVSPEWLDPHENMVRLTALHTTADTILFIYKFILFEELRILLLNSFKPKKKNNKKQT